MNRDAARHDPLNAIPEDESESAPSWLAWFGLGICIGVVLLAVTWWIA